MRQRRTIHWMEHSLRKVFLCPCTRSCIVAFDEFQRCAIYVPWTSQKECQLSRSTEFICSFQQNPPYARSVLEPNRGGNAIAYMRDRRKAYFADEKPMA